MSTRAIWIVAVSGGPDSMALLDVLYNRGYKLVVAHVNYLTRETSLRDQKIIETYCKERKIELKIKKFHVEATNNFQHDAREFRYDFFKDLVLEFNANGVAIGHHFDDDLETYVFQKERKMHSDAVGMSKKTVIKGIKVWRPLLEWRKDAVLKYCHEKNIEYGIDESNLELDYTRNQIRQSISLLSFKEYQQLVNEMMAKRQAWNSLKKEILDSVNSWENRLPLRSYVKIEKSNRFLYLREWLRQKDVDVSEMSENYLKEIDKNIVNKTANYQLGSFTLMSSYLDLVLFKKEDYKYTIDSLEQLETSYFSIRKRGLKRQGVTVSSADFPITIRNAQEGDKIKMRYGTKKVSRYLIDEKIPHWQRFFWPVVENAQKEIIFVAGMGCDVYHYSNNPSFYMIEYKVS